MFTRENLTAGSKETASSRSEMASVQAKTVRGHWAALAKIAGGVLLLAAVVAIALKRGTVVVETPNGKLPEGVEVAFFYVDGCLTEFHQVIQ